MPLIFYTTVLIVLKHAILSNTTQNVLQIDKTEDQKFYRLRYIKLHLYSDHCMRMPLRQFEDHVDKQFIWLAFGIRTGRHSTLFRTMVSNEIKTEMDGFGILSFLTVGVNHLWLLL